MNNRKQSKDILEEIEDLLNGMTNEEFLEQYLKCEKNLGPTIESFSEELQMTIDWNIKINICKDVLNFNKIINNKCLNCKICN